MNIKNPFNSIKNILKQIILDQNYNNPENMLIKAEKFLDFLKTSPHEQDRKKYQEILNKIQTDHNLKPLFDYYFKKKREERLKMFLLLQIQKKGKGAKHLRSKNHKKDEKDKEDDFIYQAFKYHKSDFKEHEAFQLLDIKITTEEYVKHNKSSLPYKIIDGKNQSSVNKSYLKEDKLNSLFNNLSIEEKRVMQDVKELDSQNELKKEHKEKALSYKNKLEQGTLSSNKNIGFKNREEIQDILEEEKEKEAFTHFQKQNSEINKDNFDVMKIDFVAGEDFVNNILNMVNQQNILKEREKQEKIKASLNSEKEFDIKNNEYKRNNSSDNHSPSSNNEKIKNEEEININKDKDKNKELAPKYKQIFDTLPEAYQNHIAKNSISYQEAVLKHYGYRKDFNNEDFENSLNYVKVNQILNPNNFDFDNVIT